MEEEDTTEGLEEEGEGLEDTAIIMGQVLGDL